MTTDRVTQYALDVIEGRKIAGETEFLACKRHLNDLKRQGSEEFPFYFDSEKANELIEFAELLTIAEGMEKKPLKLFGFQAFIFGSLHGWVNEKGFRRFRTSYVQLSRQQGKSLFNAVLSLFYGNFSGYQYPQVYTVATKQAQAMIVVRECIKFINADEELSETFTIKEYAGKILCEESNGYIQALGADTKSIDGFRSYLGSIDEYHAHKTDQMYKLLVDGTKQLPESLISVITTSGFDLNSPCFELYQYCKNVVAEAVIDETQFVFITEMDKDDDPFDEKNWPKSNPLWTEQGLESLKTFAIKAKSMGGREEMNFLTKSLNMWVDFADSSYIKASDWKECGSKRSLIVFLLEHPEAQCYAGLDLSSGGDLTSLALVFIYFVDGQRKYYVYSHSFIPEKRVLDHEQSDKVPYRMWIRQGLLTVTQTLMGVKTDYKYIISHLKELIDEYKINLQMICYDPHNASAFLSDLEELGYSTLMVTQSARNLNDPTTDFGLEVEAKNVEYDENNHLITWSIVNSKVIYNSFKEKKIEKNVAIERIDAIDAIIDAWKMAMTCEAINYNATTNSYLDMMDW